MLITKEDLKLSIPIHKGINPKLLFEKDGKIYYVKYDRLPNESYYGKSYGEIFYKQLANKFEIPCIECDFCKTEISYQHASQNYYDRAAPNLSDSHFKKDLLNGKMNQKLLYKGIIMESFLNDGESELTFFDFLTDKEAGLLQKLFQNKLDNKPKNKYYNDGECCFGRLNLYNVQDLIVLLKMNFDAKKYSLENFEEIRDDIYKRAILDWFIYESDRHNDNISFVRSYDEPSFIKMAPSFDNGYMRIFCDEEVGDASIKNMKDKINNINRKTFNKNKYKIAPGDLDSSLYYSELSRSFNSYSVFDDIGSYYKIWQLAKENKSVKKMLNQLITLNLDEEFVKFNEMAKLGGVESLTPEETEISKYALAVKQKALKCLVINKLVKNSRDLQRNKVKYSIRTKNLFNLLNKTENKMSEGKEQK